MCEQLLPDLNSPKQSVEKRDNLKNWNSPRFKFAADPQRGRNKRKLNGTSISLYTVHVYVQTHPLTSTLNGYKSNEQINRNG